MSIAIKAFNDKRVDGYPGTAHPMISGKSPIILRKEVIQPQVPLRLPCYDLVPLTSLTFGRSIGAGLRVLPAWVT